MAFILSANRRDPSQSVEAFRRYRSYLTSVETRFPPSALGLATSDWYFENGPKSPHDGWLESLQLREVASGDRQQVRPAEMTITLLGAFHDGYIELTYRKVFGYSISGSFSIGPGVGSHGDWLYDEFTLSDRGNLLHEIEWQSGVWKIEADDVLYRWLPSQEKMVKP